MASCISSFAWIRLMVTLIYCEAATISPGDGPRSFSWPASDHPSHQYSRNQIPVTAVQKNQYFGDVIQGKPLEILMRTVVQSNLKSSFVENPAASDDFVVNNSPRGRENVISDVNMMGEDGLLRKRLNVRRKRCGKGVAKKANSLASSILKAAIMNVVDEVSQNASATKRVSEETILSTAKDILVKMNSAGITTTEPIVGFAGDFRPINSEQLNSSSLPKFSADDENAETTSNYTSPSLSSVTATTADNPESSSKETISRGTTITTHSSTTTETNQDDLSSTDTETTDSTTTESSEESTTTSETTTESSEESTTTSETTTESSEESTTTSETTEESSPSTDAIETTPVSTTKETTLVSTKTETDKRATSTNSEAGDSSMSSTPTSVVTSLSTTAKVTPEDSSMEVVTEAVTEAESSSTFTENPYTIPVHSTKIDYESSSRDDSESFTTDASTKRDDKDTVLSPATVAWIVIGILLVLATFSGLIFLIHKYRPVYQRRDDTIALVRNPHHRTYY